jgi:hypothetical protein
VSSVRSCRQRLQVWLEAQSGTLCPPSQWVCLGFCSVVLVKVSSAVVVGSADPGNCVWPWPVSFPIPLWHEGRTRSLGLPAAMTSLLRLVVPE